MRNGGVWGCWLGSVSLFFFFFLKQDQKVKGDRSVVISIVLSLNYLRPHTARLSEMSSDLHPRRPSSDSETEILTVLQSGIK